MSELTELTLGDFAENALTDLYKQYDGLGTPAGNTAALGPDEIQLLSQKLLKLPHEYIAVLFMRYIFKNSSAATEEMLGISYANGRLIYVKKLLAHAMDLPEDTLVAEECMEAACRSAFEDYMRETESQKGNLVPVYSKKFKKTLKKAGITQKTSNLAAKIVKRVAIFVVVTVLAGTVTLTANAQLRQQLINWIVETFPEFSRFSLEPAVEAPAIESLANYQLAYLPDGYEAESMEYFEGIFFTQTFVNGNGWIDIQIKTPTDKRVNTMNTEGSAMQNIIFAGEAAYYWEKNGLHYLVWQQDGLEFTLRTTVSKDELFRIAESVENKN